jgi:amino acid transporter
MKELERDLGLPSVLAISIGAMIGSGIFILPALALEIAGPAVILAYLIAGLLVIPAALSKSEMATAMPEAGGTYIYIERGMGPLLGTIAGVGTWFSLSFKGALALVGGVPYLLLLFDLPLKPVALGLAAVLILVNVVGAKQTGRLQLGIVVVMLAALGWFAAASAPSVQGGNYANFFGDGIGGLLAATGLVFVSYAGVTKVASVAEEVENPGKNIPLGILGSLAFTTILYVGIVAVLVGVTDPGSVAGSLTPVAVAAEQTLGTAGVYAVIGAAILALVSTANAGILSSSRYPFAMSRDKLAPPSLSGVSDRFGTPVTSITLTGAVLLALIAFVPILEIAKLASAFQIMVFALVNVAVVAFRNGSATYEPEFESPLYPWMQLFGVVTGALLLTQMGTIALLGAVVIVVGSVAWYFAYVRPRVSREGEATKAVRRQLGEDALSEVAATDGDARDVLVAFTKAVGERRERALLSLAADMVRADDGRVTAVRFQEIPDQAPLTEHATVQSPEDRSFESRVEGLAGDLGVAVEADEIVSHDTKHAIVNFAANRDVDAIVAEHEPLRLRSRVLGDPIDWVVRHAPCDVVLVDNLGYDDPKRVVLAGDGGPYAPTAVNVADAIAAANDGRMSLWNPAGGDAAGDDARATRDYEAELSSMLSVPVHAESYRTDGGQLEPPDLVVRSGPDHRVRTALFENRPAFPAPDCTTLTVFPHTERRSGVVRRAIEKAVF